MRSEPIALLLRYLMTMLQRRTIFLDSSGGLAGEIAQTITKNDVLVAISFRHYAKEVVSITEEASDKKIPIIAITDSQLSPIAKGASVLFTVPEEEYSFSRSLAREKRNASLNFNSSCSWLAPLTFKWTTKATTLTETSS